jgi:hypothetical protein
MGMKPIVDLERGGGDLAESEEASRPVSSCRMQSSMRPVSRWECASRGRELIDLGAAGTAASELGGPKVEAMDAA